MGKLRESERSLDRKEGGGERERLGKLSETEREIFRQKREDRER